MNVTLKRQNDQYIAVVNLSGQVIHQKDVFQVPIQPVSSRTKLFSAEICGFRAESASVDSMPQMIQHLLNNLVNYGRLPNYAFIARRARRVYPVYTIEDEVMATTPGGPVFQHVELAKVRQYLTAYLHDAKILGKDGKSDKLHVRGINRHNLGLRRPQFYLKKSVSGEADFWAPVFENGKGDGFYTYAADTRRDTYKANGLGVLRMRSLVAELLVTQKRLGERLDLRADRLQPDVWALLEKSLQPVGVFQINDTTLKMYTDGYETIAVEHRSAEDRYGLYVGSSADDVVQRVGADFKRRGI